MELLLEDKMCSFFSIIVPVYNVEKYIEKCLKSIYNQSFSDYEVIIVNDGTKDKSRDLIMERCLYDERFRLYDKENGGLSSARNEGMKHANGEYVIFIDSDDWIEIDYLCSIKNVIKKSADVLICKYQLDDTIIGARYIPYESEHINKNYSGIEKEKEIVERHLIAYPRSGYEIKDTIMPVWKNVYKRDFIKRHNLLFESERKVMAEDYVFNTLAYYYASNIQVIDISGYVHVIVPGTLSRSYRENAVEMTICKHEMVMNFINCMEFADKKSIKNAEMTNYAMSFAGDIRNFCLSEEKNKIDKIGEWYANSKLRVIFETKITLNLQYSVHLCTWIMLFKSPIIDLIAFRIIGEFNYLYRTIQKKIRK